MKSFSTASPVPQLQSVGIQVLRSYFEWFLSLVPQRLDRLPHHVSETPGFEGWDADYSPESLRDLSEWFASKVRTRRRTQQELAEIASMSPYPIEVPTDELTEETFSICHDVAIYFAEVLRRQHPSLIWAQISGSKRKFDYGHAGLKGFRADFSPVHILITLGYAISTNRVRAKTLPELYDAWSKLVAI